MLIGEVSKRTGLTRDTIRFYEKKKLIVVKRTESKWNNYKDYGEGNIHRLLLIKKCKGFGFTLGEIREILTLVDTNDATCDVMAHLVAQKLLAIENKIKELRQVKKMILDKVDAVADTSCDGRETKTNCDELTVRN